MLECEVDKMRESVDGCFVNVMFDTLSVLLGDFLFDT